MMGIQGRGPVGDRIRLPEGWGSTFPGPDGPPPPRWSLPEDDHLPLAEEIPNDKGGCPTCKAMIACHTDARNYMRVTGYCSIWCHAHAKFPIPADPKVHVEPRRSYD